MLKIIFCCLLSLISLTAFAEGVEDSSKQALVLQIVENQFVFDNSNIKAATIIKHEDGSYAGLQLTLKPGAVDEFVRITQSGVGKRVAFILNGKLVYSTLLQAPLAAQLLISGISLDDAKAFINILQINKAKGGSPDTLSQV